MCENSLLILFSIITKEHITAVLAIRNIFDTFVIFEGASTDRFHSLITYLDYLTIFLLSSKFRFDESDTIRTHLQSR